MSSHVKEGPEEQRRPVEFRHPRGEEVLPGDGAETSDTFSLFLY